MSHIERKTKPDVFKIYTGIPDSAWTAPSREQEPAIQAMFQQALSELRSRIDYLVDNHPVNVQYPKGERYPGARSYKPLSIVSAVLNESLSNAWESNPDHQQRAFQRVVFNLLRHAGAPIHTGSPYHFRVATLGLDRGEGYSGISHSLIVDGTSVIDPTLNVQHVIAVTKEDGITAVPQLIVCPDRSKPAGLLSIGLDEPYDASRRVFDMLFTGQTPNATRLINADATKIYRSGTSISRK